MLRKNSGETYIVKIGEQEVYQSEWDQILHQHIQELKHTYGENFSEADIDQKVFREAILSKIINRSILFQESQRLGVLVSDEMVKYEIAAQPTFQGKDGKFSKEVFANFIHKSGLSETKFIDAMKEDIAVNNLIHPFTFYNLPSPQFLDQVNFILNAGREVDFYEINQNKIVVKTTPTTQELERLLDGNRDRFSSPEIRNVSYLSFSIKDVDQNVEITDEELQSNYQSKLFLFTKPETRTIHHLIFQELDKALEAKQQIDTGKDFEAVGKTLGAKNKETYLGELTRDGFEREIADAIFTLKTGQVSRPVQSPLGFHIFKVINIAPQKTSSFTEVKETLKKQYLEEKLFERLSNLAQQMDNDIANNKPLDEIAAKYNFTIAKATVINDKNHKDSELSSSPAFKTTALHTDLHTTSMVTPYNDETFFAIRVERIIPQKLQTFNEAKAGLLQFWKEEQKVKLTESTASELVKLLRSNKPLPATLLSTITMKKLKINRWNTESFSHDFLDLIYKLKVNDVTQSYRNEGKLLVAKLTKLNPPSNEQLKKGMVELQRLYAQSQPDITLTEYLNAVKDTYKVKVNNELLNK